MRSFKKVLTLALVFAMALGLLSAGALDFSDADDIQYKEAVEVMVAIGAINGRPDGSFDPEGLITRAEAAKLVAYTVLTPKVAELLPGGSSSFTDVPATYWASKFIEYCVSQNIIKGRGAGKFDPTGNVTAFELAAMLLRAVGYGRNGEYEGASWSFNVLKDAMEHGIFTGSKAENYGAPATREEAALYFFNAFNPDTGIVQVKWNKNTESYDPITGTNLQIMDKYGLSKDPSPVNGVNGYTWKIAGKAVTSFFATENVVGTSTDGTAIATLANKSSSKFIAELDTVVTYVINGRAIPEYTNGAVYAQNDLVSYQGVLYEVTASGGLTASDTSAALTGASPKAAVYTIKSGVVVKFINTDTDAKVEKVSLTEKEIKFVTGAPSVNPTTGDVTLPGVSGTAFEKDTVVYPSDLAYGDFVLVYLDESTTPNVTRVEKATKVTGQMTSANTVAKTIVFGGKTYKESGLVQTADSVVKEFYWDSTGPAFKNQNFNVDAVAFLDDNGDIVGIYTVTQQGPTAKYGLVVDYQYTAGTTDGTSGALGTPASAKVLLYTEDGAVAVYNVAKNPATGVVPNQGSEFNFSGSIKAYLVQYSFNDAGEVTLTIPTSFKTGTVGAAGTAKSPVINIDPTGSDPAANYYITSNTKVIYFNDQAAYAAGSNVAKFVTGYANTDAASASKNVTFKLAAGSATNLEVIFIGQAPATVTVPGNYAYVHTVNENVRYVNGVAFYDYNVYINGEKATLTSKTPGLFGATGLYTYAVDGDGLVTGTPSHTGAVTAPGNVTYVESGFVAYVEGTSNKSVPIDANTKFYKVTTTGVVEDTIAASTTYVTYSIKYILTNAQGVATAIYFTVTP